MFGSILLARGASLRFITEPLTSYSQGKSQAWSKRAGRWIDGFHRLAKFYLSPNTGLGHESEASLLLEFNMGSSQMAHNNKGDPDSMTVIVNHLGHVRHSFIVWVFLTSARSGSASSLAGLLVGCQCAHHPTHCITGHQFRDGVLRCPV